MSKKTSTHAPTTLATVALSFAVAAAAFGQEPSVRVHGDDITIRGCVGRASPGSALTQPTLVWSRSDIMLGSAMLASGTGATPLVDHVFYWLDHEEDLAKHVGQQVEIKGDLADLKKGEIELKRDGAYTNIELKLGDKKEKARVPTAWLGISRDEGDVQIVSRKIKVDKVKTLGPCERP